MCSKYLKQFHENGLDICLGFISHSIFHSLCPLFSLSNSSTLFISLTPHVCPLNSEQFRLKGSSTTLSPKTFFKLLCKKKKSLVVINKLNQVSNACSNHVYEYPYQYFCLLGVTLTIKSWSTQIFRTLFMQHCTLIRLYMYSLLTLHQLKSLLKTVLVSYTL